MIQVNSETAAGILAQPLDPQLRSLLEERLSDAATLGLSDLTEILVIQGPRDTEDAIIQAIGWSPLVDPYDEEVRWSDASFVPCWSSLDDLGAYFELMKIIDGSSFAYILLIEKAEGVIPELLQMCVANWEETNFRNP